MQIQTSDVGSQYRCGRVGRGIQPPASPQPHPQLPSHTLTHTNTQCNNCSIINARFSHFQLECDGRTNGRTDKACRLFLPYFVRVMTDPRCPFPISFPLTFCPNLPSSSVSSLTSSPDLSTVGRIVPRRIELSLAIASCIAFANPLYSFAHVVAS